MEIYTEGHIEAFARRHLDARQPLQDWYTVLSACTAKHLPDLRKTFRSVDVVGKATVFDIAGNNYRLISVIKYSYQIAIVLEVMTHAEYSKNRWQKKHRVFD